MSLNFKVGLKKQRGFLMPLALFIVVGLGALALALSRAGTASASSVVLEGISTQAFYAAESGAQYAMHRLMFDASDRVEVDGRCAVVDGDSLALTVSGLSGCRVKLKCDRQVILGSEVHIYNLTSAATCGGGDLIAKRTLSVSALLE